MRSRTTSVVSGLLMLGNLLTVLALVVGTLMLVVLVWEVVDESWSWLSGLDPCCVDVSSTERELCRRFFLR